MNKNKNQMTLHIKSYEINKIKINKIKYFYQAATDPTTGLIDMDVLVSPKIYADFFCFIFNNSFSQSL